MHLRLPVTVLLALIALLTTGAPVTAASAAAEDDPAAIAWSLETVDGENGAGRANFAYEADPGAILTDTLRVTNTGGSPLELAIYPADAYTTSTGSIDLDPPDVAPDGAGAWIAPAQTAVLLQPGAQADIPFTVTVPADATPGDHAAGIITSLRTGGSSTLSVDRRLATRVTVRVSGDLVPAIDVSDVRAEYRGSWNPFAPGVLVLDYTLTNAGNTRVTGIEAIEARAPLGLTGVSTGPQPLSEVIPGSTIEVRREIEVAPWGVVSGEVMIAPEAIGLGAQDLAEVSRDYSVAAIPWALLILVVLIAAVVVIVIVVRRRRRTPPSPTA